jgi:hypothetical protein
MSTVKILAARRCPAARAPDAVIANSAFMTTPEKQYSVVRMESARPSQVPSTAPSRTQSFA